MRNRRQEESDSFFCRFTFGQFFALLVLEVFTLFFVFYLGARYGQEFLGLKIKGDSSVAEHPAGAEPSTPKVATTDDPDAAKMAKELVTQAKTPELKERISQMFEAAKKGGKEAKLPPVLEVHKVKEISEGADSAEKIIHEAKEPTQAGRETPPVRTTEQKVLEQRAGSEDPTALPSVHAKGEENRMGDDTESKGASDKSVVRVKSADNGRYSLQIGSYPQMAEATHIVEKWKGKGYSAYMMIADIPDRGRWYRVRIGGFGSREDAAKYLKDFESKENAEALIVMNEQ